MSVQPMSVPASLIFYLRYRYGGPILKPASPEVLGAVLLWFQETFAYLKIEQRESAYKHLLISADSRARVAVLNVWDGRIDFYRDNFEMTDPEMFTKLHAAVIEYFSQARSNDNEKE